MRIVPLEPPRGTRENWPHTLRVGGPVFWESEATGVRLLKDKDGAGIILSRTQRDRKKMSPSVAYAWPVPFLHAESM